jgi:hypothetical protein
MVLKYKLNLKMKKAIITGITGQDGAYLVMRYMALREDHLYLIPKE